MVVGHGRPRQKTGAGPDDGARARMAGCRSDQGPGRSSQQATCDRSAGKVLVHGIIGLPTGLILSPIPAGVFIGLERLE
jgi:hypothetical protein